MPSVPKLYHYAVKELWENCSVIANCVVKLQLLKVRELDVCGSLVLVTISGAQVWPVFSIKRAGQLCVLRSNKPHIIQAVNVVSGDKADYYVITMQKCK